jgi:uncharacterized protein
MRVSGLNKTMANNVVSFRDEHGRFNNRNELKKVARLGPKAFEQAAGFLRINNGNNPLDFSGVHPETYSLVEQLLKQLNTDINNVIGNKAALEKINVESLVSDAFGEVTVKDIISELEKPGRDPRPEFKTATFQEGVNTINDLKVGMILEGIISNVANFGAFVDIGVHQDGLVHISSLTDKFVSDPHEIVKAGEVVKVKVTEVDPQRKRISLTMRLDEAIPQVKSQPSEKSQKVQHHDKNIKPQNNKNKARTPQPKKDNNAAMGNAFADAFAKLKK